MYIHVFMLVCGFCEVYIVGLFVLSLKCISYILCVVLYKVSVCSAVPRLMFVFFGLFVVFQVGIFVHRR